MNTDGGRIYWRVKVSFGSYVKRKTMDPLSEYLDVEDGDNFRIITVEAEHKTEAFLVAAQIAACTAPTRGEMVTGTELVAFHP